MREAFDPVKFQEGVDRRRSNRMAGIDALPQEVRGLVHEYGLKVVRAHLDLGITKARHIRHLVETTLDEFTPTRGSSSSQGVRAAFGMDGPKQPKAK